MAVIEALRTALGALKRNPVLFVAGLLFGLVTLPQTVAQFAGIPFLPLLFQALAFFVTPFLLAGILGMALEAQGEYTSLSTLTDYGKARYVPLLLGNVIEFAIALAVGIVAGIVGLVAALTLGGIGGGAPSAPALALVGFGAAVVALVVVAVFFFIQFFPVAIVVDDVGPIDGFTRSVSFVRDHLLATLGYSLIRFAVAMLVSAPVTGFVLYRTLGSQPFGAAATPGGAPGMAGGSSLTLPPVEIAALAAASLVMSTLLVAFQQTYAVAFYTRLLERENLLLE